MVGASAVGLLLVELLTRFAGLQRYVVPPPAVSIAVPLAQVAWLGEIVNCGTGFTATMMESVFVQPFVPVIVTR